MKTLRDRVAALKEKRIAEKRAQHVRTKERAERKKLNEMKSSSFQVVSFFSSCKLFRLRNKQKRESGTLKRVEHSRNSPQRCSMP